MSLPEEPGIAIRSGNKDLFASSTTTNNADTWILLAVLAKISYVEIMFVYRIHSPAQYLFTVVNDIDRKCYFICNPSQYIDTRINNLSEIENKYTSKQQINSRI